MCLQRVTDSSGFRTHWNSHGNILDELRSWRLRTIRLYGHKARIIPCRVKRSDNIDEGNIKRYAEASLLSMSRAIVQRIYRAHARSAHKARRPDDAYH